MRIRGHLPATVGAVLCALAVAPADAASPLLQSATLTPEGPAAQLQDIYYYRGAHYRYRYNGGYYHYHYRGRYCNHRYMRHGYWYC